MRLFIAWPLPDDVRREIASRIEPLGRRLPAASWPRPESLHLTLLFLGETAEDRLPRLMKALDSLSTAAAATARVSGAGFFPSRSRPRVAWVGLAPAEPVAAIAAGVRGAARERGFAGVDSDRPFHAHFTIARIKGGWNATNAGTFEAAFAGWTSRPLTLDRVVLYRSHLSPNGADHVALHEVAMAEGGRGGAP